MEACTCTMMLSIAQDIEAGLLNLALGKSSHAFTNMLCVQSALQCCAT